MRKISNESIVVFLTMLLISVLFSVAILKLTILRIPLGAYEGIIATGSFVFIYFANCVFLYRIFFYFFPIKEGDISERTKAAFSHDVYSLFYLLIFRSVICTSFVPTPIMRIVYLLLGAQLGANTYCTGIILDPPLTKIGSNTIIGQDALLYSHAIEGHFLSYKIIEIGDNVTVGAKSVIMSGVTIGSNSILAAGAVVLKNTRIGSHEVWGGVPAKFIKRLNSSEITK
ncbi:MAG: DapH/DapD/GlmU-related protein [Desulfobacterales bacterium]|nr:DapH/DapD/GlmU-related protein [Desulfobacterales bacterium]